MVGPRSEPELQPVTSVKGTATTALSSVTAPDAEKELRAVDGLGVFGQDGGDDFALFVDIFYHVPVAQAMTLCQVLSSPALASTPTRG